MPFQNKLLSYYKANYKDFPDKTLKKLKGNFNNIWIFRKIKIVSYKRRMTHHILFMIVFIYQKTFISTKGVQIISHNLLSKKEEGIGIAGT